MSKEQVKTPIHVRGIYEVNIPIQHYNNNCDLKLFRSISIRATFLSPHPPAWIAIWIQSWGDQVAKMLINRSIQIIFWY